VLWNFFVTRMIRRRLSNFEGVVPISFAQPPMPMSNSEHLPVTREVLELFRLRGDSEYGGEAVTQLEHALQAATFAEREGASAQLIAAALLHDVGHLLHELPADAPDQGIDDRHEALATVWLAERFGPPVVAPVAMHVAAKRYLCAVDGDYFSQLSPPSVQSLALQGGPMATAEIEQFRSRPFYDDAVRLRRWDDAAKIVDMQTPTLEHFARYLDLAGGSAV
jgi:phosphonate degradation associated HDIG domain protein